MSFQLATADCSVPFKSVVFVQPSLNSEMASEPDQQPPDVARSVTPSVDDIMIAVQQLLLKEPTMGLKKLHAGVRALHSDWLVSEARVKKIRDGLADSMSSAAAAAPLVDLPSFDEHGRVAGTSTCGLNFNFRSISSFVPELAPAVMTQLHNDCRRAFLMKSYWLAATAAPRCMLEAVARSVFDFHTQGVAFDPASSGAEWWVHFRGPGEDKKLGESRSRAAARHRFKHTNNGLQGRVSVSIGTRMKRWQTHMASKCTLKSALSLT